MNEHGPAGPEGEILIQVSGGGTTRQVTLRSSRPVTACRVLEGRPVDDALATVPLLFSVCGRAQSLASHEACEAARGRAVDPVSRAARLLRLEGELVREHAWRLLLDWPPLLGSPPMTAAFRRIQGAVVDLEARLDESAKGRLKADPGGPVDDAICALAQTIEAEVLGSSAIATNSPEGLAAWSGESGGVADLFHGIRTAGISSLGAAPSEPMPPWDMAELEAMLAADTGADWVRAPRWHDRVYETGPLARQGEHPWVHDTRRLHGDGVLARITARMVELVTAPAAMRAVLADHPGAAVARHASESGMGLAVVETARGRLAHRVELDGDRVKRYQILAPTEWNFHPAGPLTGVLESLEGNDAEAFVKAAGMVITALDPCVGYRIEFR